MKLAYADPPYPGKAHLYSENTEVDHAELVERLLEYDGWALSTDEANLAYVLSLCPPRTRVLAWCRTNAAPLLPQPWASWEPVLMVPARTSGVSSTRSFLTDRAVSGPKGGGPVIGRKTPEFCAWVTRCLGAQHGDTLVDLFPGSGVMEAMFTATISQPTLWEGNGNPRSRKERSLMARRVQDGLDGMPERVERLTRLDR